LFAPETPSDHELITGINYEAMTDSPRLSLPIDPEERPIEGQLLQIRSKLELLKADKSNYVKSEDVVKLYEEVIVQVNALNEIRKSKRHEQNRGAYTATSGDIHLPRRQSEGFSDLRMSAQSGDECSV
jgi:hypothetical protein